MNVSTSDENVYINILWIYWNLIDTYFLSIVRIWEVLRPYIYIQDKQYAYVAYVLIHWLVSFNIFLKYILSIFKLHFYVITYLYLD